MKRNPFQFAAPITRPEALVDRDRELDRLVGLADSGTYVMLEAPRRYGKTSLLKACADRWRANGGLAVWVDFSRVLTAEEAARRLERALAEDHPGWQDVLSEMLRSLRLRLGPVEFTRPPGRAAADGERLHELLEIPAAAARQRPKRSLVCLDEFQDVLSVPGLDGIIRSHVQHHAEDVSYVFSGSEPSLLRSLFADRARPLYSQAKPLRLGRIAPESLAAHIAARFAAAGVDGSRAAEAIAAAGEGHPQRTILLAWHLWDRAAAGSVLNADDAAAAIASAIDDAVPEMEATWRSVAGNERRVIVALALGLAPFSKSAKERTGVASASAAQRALERLVESGLVDPESRTLTDPLLAMWLRREHG